MNTLKLKADLHEIVDSIQNEQLLQTVYDFLKTNENSETGTLWASLNGQQKQELLLSFQESENDKNLIDHSHVL